MHPAAFSYLSNHLASLDLKGKAVLEIGSYDVNATAQGLVLRDACRAAKRYVGIDERLGPGVDVASPATDYTPDALFDVVLCAETLEHTAEPALIIGTAWRALKAGGVLLLTAAAPERTPHGCDGGALPPTEAYTPITPAMLEAMLCDWQDVAIEHHPHLGDVYACAIKPDEG